LPAPSRLYERGGIWYRRVQIGGREHRQSLRTKSREEALRRLSDVIAEIEQSDDSICAGPSEKTVNNKGDIGVARAVADLVARGYVVYLPFSGAGAVDLIVADKCESLRRLQVKYRALDRGHVSIKLNTVINGRATPIDRGKIDGWAVYCPNVDGVYYVPQSIVRSRRWINIYVEGPRQQARALKGEAYRDPKNLWRTDAVVSRGTKVSTG